MPYLSNAQRKAIWARRNAADKEVVIDNAQTKQKLTKGDVGQYYGDPRIREELIKGLRNRDLLAVMSRNPDKHIFKRYEAKNKPLRVQGEDDLSRFVTRRYTEFHPTIGKKTKEIWVDIDSGKDLTTGTLKPLTQEVSTLVKRMPEVANTNIAFSGGDGFYVRGLLKRTQSTDRMRSRLKEELAELVKKHKHVTMSPPAPDEVRLDISTLHNKGSIRAPYSLNAETGLVSVPVTSKQLPTFKPTRDALPANVIKNLKYFAPGIPKTKVTREIPTQQEQSHWTLAVQEHKAQRAGKHWDVRLVDPNTGYAHSWAVPKARMPEEKALLAIQQPTHTADYALNFGLGAPKIIGKGYGKGSVEIKHKEPVKVLKSTPDYVKFERLEDGVPKNYMLIRTKDTSWIMKKGSTMKKTANQIADAVLYKVALLPKNPSNRVSTKPSSFELQAPLNAQDEQAPAGLLAGALNDIEVPPKREGTHNNSSRGISARLNAPTSWGASTSLPSNTNNSPVLGQF